MPLRVEGPTRTEMKPKPWRVNPRFVAPKWRWAWESVEFLAPVWAGGGSVVRDLVTGTQSSEGAGDPTWAVNEKGVCRDYAGSPDADSFGHVEGLGFGAGDFTIACLLVNRETGQIQTYFSQGESGGDGPGFNLFVNTFNSSDRVAVVEVGDGTSGVSVESPNDTINDGQIHLVTCSRRGSDLELYVDGALEGTNTTSLDMSNSLGCHFGRMDPSGTEFPANGQVLMAGGWSTGWSAEQHAQLARDPFGPFRRQTIRYTGGPAAAGQTFTVSLAEAVVARDTLKDTATLTVEVADVASAQSTETETLTMRETVSEVGVAADQLTDAQVMVEVLSEAARANDQMVGTLGRVFAAVLTESVSATDTVESRMTAVEAIAETVRAADQLNITATLRETLAESAVAADTVTAPVAGVITATLKESVSAGDTLEDTMTMTAQVREAVRALDRLGLTQTLVTQVIEQAAASDQLQSTLPAEALRFIFDAVRGNQDFDAVDGGTFDAQGKSDFDASGAD